MERLAPRSSDRKKFICGERQANAVKSKEAAQSYIYRLFIRRRDEKWEVDSDISE
jgi:hypothetical protein